MEEIKNSDGDDIVILEYCPEIGEYVLGLNNARNPKIGLEIKNEKTSNIKIIATLSTEVLGRTFDDIKKSLTDKYKDCLTQRNFSRIKLKWAKYSDDDLETIDEALKN